DLHRPPLPRTQLRWIIPYPVVPAKAGTQEPPRVARPWIPACAGMTVNESTCPGHALPHHVGIDDDLGPPGGLGERHGVLRQHPFETEIDDAHEFQARKFRIRLDPHDAAVCRGDDPD